MFGDAKDGFLAQAIPSAKDRALCIKKFNPHLI